MGIYIGQQRLNYLWEKIKTLVSAKQDVLSFDNTPTSGSTNPVTSGGIHSFYNDKEKVIAAALNDLEARKLNASEIGTDEVPTENSTNFVTSGGLYNVITENEEIVASAINDLNDKKADISSLSPVATSGSYNDLTNKPEISSAVTEQTVSDWGFTKNGGTVNSITINTTSPITIDNSAAITTSGTRTISHGNSGVSAGTYKSVTVDAKGHVTGGTNPTTLSGYGITDALNTSSTAQTKAGNLTAAKFIKSGGTSSQFLKADGSVDSNTYAPLASPALTGTPTAPTAANGTKTTQIANTAFVDNATTQSFNKIISMGENLVINGNGYMMDNTNFSSSVFNLLINNSSFGSFEYSGKKVVSSDYRIPLNPSLKYKLSADVKALNTGGSFFGYIDFYDIDGHRIEATNHMWHSDQCSYLTQDLNPGDTVVHINDLSKWNNTYAGHSLSKGITFWNYTNSKGYTYPPYTYTRNFFRNMYNEDTDVDAENGIIHLKSAWTGTVIPANTKISRTDSGSTFKYLWLKTPTTDSWLTCYGFCSGIDYSGSNAIGKFPPGTAFGKIGFLVNYGTEEETWITNISLTTCAQIVDIPAAVTESTVSGWGFTKNTGTYSKPSAGIPKTDLASAVQTSLGKADTALQSFTETDPTVPSWAKASTKPSYTASEVGALPASTVIPAAPGTLNTTATTAQSTNSSEALSGNITLHKVAKTGTYNDLIGKPTIPSEVTESTVSSWGFTKNTGTYSKPSEGIPKTDLASAVQTSLGKADTALQSYTETDPVFSASAAAGISSTDISNWNSKTSNVGTITGITMNGASKGTSGVVDLGTVITAHQSLSGKQDVINDLATIRSNASSGASAATTIAGYGDIVTHNASEFQTKIIVSSSNPSGGNNGDIWIVI